MDEIRVSNFPHVSDDAIMVYTLKKWYLASYWTNSNQLDGYINQARQDTRGLKTQVVNRLRAIDDTAQVALQNVCDSFGLSYNGENPRELINKFMATYNQQLNQARTQAKRIEQEKTQEISRITELKTTNWSKSRYITLDDLKTIMKNGVDKMRGQTEEEIWQYISNEATKDFSEEIKEKYAIAVKDYAKGWQTRIFKDSQEFKQAIQTTSEKKINAAVNKYVRRYKEYINGRIVEAYKLRKKELINDIMGDFDIILDALTKENNSITNFQTDMAQYYRNIKKSDQTLAVKIGYLYETATARDVVDMDFFNQGNNTMEFTGTGTDYKNITNDLEVSLKDAQTKLGISVKSAIGRLGSHKKDILLKDGNDNGQSHRLFIQNYIDDMMRGNEDVWKYLIANTFSINMRGEEIPQGYDEVGKVRRELMKVAAIKFVLGRFYTDYAIDSSGSEVKTGQDLINSLSAKTFPLIVQMPQGAVFSVDLIDSFIQQMTKLKLGKNGYAQSLVGETSGNPMQDGELESWVKQLQNLNYTFNLLSDMHNENDDLSHLNRSSYSQDGQIKELQYPYSVSGLRQAYEIMQWIYSYLTDERMSVILRSNMSIWSEDISKIMMNYN